VITSRIAGPSCWNADQQIPGHLRKVHEERDHRLDGLTEVAQCGAERATQRGAHADQQLDHRGDDVAQTLKGGGQPGDRGLNGAVRGELGEDLADLPGNPADGRTERSHRRGRCRCRLGQAGEERGDPRTEPADQVGGACEHRVQQLDTTRGGEARHELTGHAGDRHGDVLEARRQLGQQPGQVAEHRGEFALESTGDGSLELLEGGRDDLSGLLDAVHAQRDRARSGGGGEQDGGYTGEDLPDQTADHADDLTGSAQNRDELEDPDHGLDDRAADGAEHRVERSHLGQQAGRRPIRAGERVSQPAESIEDAQDPAALPVHVVGAAAPDRVQVVLGPRQVLAGRELLPAGAGQSLLERGDGRRRRALRAASGGQLLLERGEVASIELCPAAGLLYLRLGLGNLLRGSAGGADADQLTLGAPQIARRRLRRRSSAVDAGFRIGYRGRGGPRASASSIQPSFRLRHSRRGLGLAAASVADPVFRGGDSLGHPARLGRRRVQPSGRAGDEEFDGGAHRCHVKRSSGSVCRPGRA
jgi:hypothetical protein